MRVLYEMDIEFWELPQSLRNKLYKIRISKNEDMATYIMKISQLRDQLQGLEEAIYGLEMTTYVIDDFPLEWSSFATSVYSRNDTTPFHELWAQCILEKSTIKVKDDTKSNERSQAFTARIKKMKKRKFGKSKKKIDMSKIQCFGCNEYGQVKRDCSNKVNNKSKERSEAHIDEVKGNPKKKPKGEDPKDLHY